MGEETSDRGLRELDAMAKVWIEEHWGLEWPDGLHLEARPRVLALMARLRDALQGVRAADRVAAE